MYLLTFTLLVIGVLGIYTQVLAVEASRFFQSQVGVLNAMVEWHEAAVSLASNTMNPATAKVGGIDLAGCGLTAGLLTPCKKGVTITTLGAPTVAVTAGAPGYATRSYSTPTAAIYPSLPTGYSGKNYQWKSIAFQNTSGYYVITYVDPAAAGAFVTTATGTSLGITEAELFQQARNLNIPLYSYGGISGGVLTVPPILTTGGPATNISYPVPASVLDGSFGIISSFSPCTKC